MLLWPVPTFSSKLLQYAIQCFNNKHQRDFSFIHVFFPLSFLPLFTAEVEDTDVRTLCRRLLLLTLGCWLLYDFIILNRYGSFLLKFRLLPMGIISESWILLWLMIQTCIQNSVSVSDSFGHLKYIWGSLSGQLWSLDNLSQEGVGGWRRGRKK